MSSRNPHALFTLDRPGIRDAFDRASANYESAAVLQAQVNDELIDRLAFFKLDPKVILDLGCGPGRGSIALRKLFPQASIVALDFAPGMLREARRRMREAEVHCESVYADALRLPFADQSADLIFSNLMLQWCEPLRIVFAEIRRVLKPGGLFMFSTFGPDTLRELREAWAAADDGQHVNHFVDMHNVGDAVMQAGMSEPVLDLERTQLTYADVFALMRDLKTIGAHNVAVDRARGLTSRAKLQRMEHAYEKARSNGRLPATYEVIYGTAWGTGSSASKSHAGEVLISPGEIRRRG